MGRPPGLLMNSTLIFLDTETNGVSPQDRIVSICWSLVGVFV